VTVARVSRQELQESAPDETRSTGDDGLARLIGIASHASLSSVELNHFAHMQTADSKFVDLDDAEPRPPDHQAVDEQATEGERANRDCSDGKRSDCESADTLGLYRLGTDRLSADGLSTDGCRWRASRGQAFFRAVPSYGILYA
jgi:hypothetical protein